MQIDVKKLYNITLSTGLSQIACAEVTGHDLIRYVAMVTQKQGMIRIPKKHSCILIPADAVSFLEYSEVQDADSGN